jgi:SAM-dependent methyltransferase
MQRRNDDAFGAALMDCLLGRETHYIVERDDMFADPGSLTQYFTEFSDWSAIEKRMPEFVRGRTRLESGPAGFAGNFRARGEISRGGILESPDEGISSSQPEMAAKPADSAPSATFEMGSRVLDVGCGAGRHALHLQSLGFEVVGIDRSPLAIEVCKRRGVKNVFVISIDELAGGEVEIGAFDSVIMMGHNIGLLHGWDEGRNILSGLSRITSPGARIIGTTRVPCKTDDPDHLAYQQWNRERGRMPGQIRFRIRHRKLASDWLDYLFLSPDEFRALAAGTGWRLETTLVGDGGFGGESYLVVLCKE